MKRGIAAIEQDPRACSIICMPVIPAPTSYPLRSIHCCCAFAMPAVMRPFCRRQAPVQPQMAALLLCTLSVTWFPRVAALLSPDFALNPCTAAASGQHGWAFVNQTLGGAVATNLIDNGLNKTAWVGIALNCAGSNNCHAWGAGFGDRNGMFMGEQQQQ